MAHPTKISPKDRFFSQDQSWELDSLSIAEINGLGNLELLKTSKIGLLCSMRCPARIILKTQDYLSGLNSTLTVVSGFHSPLEKEGLRILLRRGLSVIICSGLSADKLKIPAGAESHVKNGKLLVLSIFPKGYKGLTERLAYQRNKFVAVLADRMLIPFADKHSKTLELIRFMVSKGKNVAAFDVRENAHLFSLGVERT